MSQTNTRARERACWVVVLVENEPYPEDVRVRNEAETLVAGGFRVTVVARRARKQPLRETIANVEVVRFWLPPTPQTLVGFIVEYLFAHLQIAWHAVSLLVRGADVLHVCNPPDSLGLLMSVAHLFRRKAVFDNHDLFPELFSLRYRNARATRILRALQRNAFRRADLILTTNESQRKAVLDAVLRPPDSVVVVRNGPRAATVTSNDLEVSASRTTESVELMFVGALEPQDGVEALGEVLDLLVHKHGLPARLTVIGAGSSREKLAKECKKRGIADRVTFTGRIPHDQVEHWLERADVCVDPAPCNELNQTSTMIKVAEYMAAGKPVVAFDLRETRRTAGDAAVYAPCGDVDTFVALIAKVTRDPELRQQMAHDAHKRLPELVWERSADALLAAYSRMIRA